MVSLVLSVIWSAGGTAQSAGCPGCSLGGVREPGLCPHKRAWSHAVYLSGFLFREHSSTYLWAGVRLIRLMQQGPGQGRSRQQTEVDLVIRSLPAHPGVQAVMVTRGPNLEGCCSAIWGSHMWPLRSPLGARSAHHAHLVLQVGEVRIPPQRQAVDVGDSELGRNEEEVHQLRSWPHAPVGLQGGAESGEGRASRGSGLRWSGKDKGQGIAGGRARLPCRVPRTCSSAPGSSRPWSGPPGSQDLGRKPRNGRVRGWGVGMMQWVGWVP